MLATHSIRHFSLYFPSRASPCAIAFQLDSANIRTDERGQVIGKSPVLVFIVPEIQLEYAVPESEKECTVSCWKNVYYQL